MEGRSRGDLEPRGKEKSGGEELESGFSLKIEKGFEDRLRSRWEGSVRNAQHDLKAVGLNTWLKGEDAG